MAQQIVWTNQAANDLQAIAEYLERDAPHYAAAVVDKIVILTRRLPDHPLMGRIVPEFDQPDIRERFVYSYRVVYQIKDANLRILNIIHGSRLYTTDMLAE